MKKLFLLFIFCLLISGCGQEKKEVITTYEDILMYVNSNDYKIYCEFLGNYLATKSLNKINSDDMKMKINGNEKEFNDRMDKICKLNGFENRVDFAKKCKNFLNEPEIVKIKDEINSQAVKINTDASKKAFSQMLTGNGLGLLQGLTSTTELNNISYGKDQAKELITKIESERAYESIK